MSADVLLMIRKDDCKKGWIKAGCLQWRQKRRGYGFRVRLGPHAVRTRWVGLTTIHAGKEGQDLGPFRSYTLPDTGVQFSVHDLNRSGAYQRHRKTTSPDQGPELLGIKASQTSLYPSRGCSEAIHITQAWKATAWTTTEVYCHWG